MAKYFEKTQIITCPHAFSTRLGGVSKGIFNSLNLGLKNDEDWPNPIENWKIFERETCISCDKIAIVTQVHKPDVKIVSNLDAKSPAERCYSGEYDGLVTNHKEITLAIFTADCTPVLLHDSKAKVIAALHCGWRPLCGDIIKNGITKMESLGAHAKNIQAGIGPCINQCCFETGIEVVDAVKSLVGNDASKCYKTSSFKDDKYYVNLRKTCEVRLAQLGVNIKNIEHVNQCTKCNSNKYFSYRADAGKTGRLASIISL